MAVVFRPFVLGLLLSDSRCLYGFFMVFFFLFFIKNKDFFVRKILVNCVLDAFSNFRYFY